MIVLFPPSATVFTSLGLGVVRPVLCTISEEINGQFALEADFTGEEAAAIVEGSILAVDTYRGKQPFRVAQIEKFIDQTVHIYAPHISNDLTGAMIVNRAPTEASATAALLSALTGTAYSGISNVPGARSARWVHKSALAAILGEEENSIVNRWGGEIERDGYTINVLQRMGNDSGVEIRYRKNLTGLHASTDISQVVTRIYPTGLAADGQTVLPLPEGFIDSASIGAYPVIYSAHMHYSDIRVGDEGFPTEADAEQGLRDRVAAEYAAGCDMPMVTLAVSFVDLSQTMEYAGYALLEAVHLGDTVRCYHEPLGVDVALRVAAVRYNALTGRFTEITLGQVSRTVVKTLQAQATAIPKLQETQTALGAAVEAAQSIFTSPGNSFVRFFPGLANPSEIVIMDTDDIDTAQKIVRLNAAGLGISTTGYAGTYTTVMTGDGVNASAINTGTLLATLIKAGVLSDIDGNFVLDMDTGSLTARSVQIQIEKEGDPGVPVATFDEHGAVLPRAAVGLLDADVVKISGRGMVQPVSRQYYWDPTKTGDGSSAANAAPNLQALVDSIPRMLDSWVDLRLAAGAVWPGNLVIKNTNGQVLTVYGNGASINGMLTVRYCDRVVFSNLKAAHVTVEGSHADFQNCTINGSTGYGIHFARSSGLLTNTEINASSKAGIYVTETSRVSMFSGCKGDCSSFAWCDRGGTLFLAGTRPYGTITATTGLGQVLGTASETHGAGYVPPPAPPVQVIPLATVASRSRNASSGWRSDTAVLQGEYVGSGPPYFYGKLTGCMWFQGLTIPAGYSVTGVRIFMRRINAGGHPGPQKVRLWHLTAPTSDTQGALTRGASVPNTAGDSDGTGNFIGTLGRDEDKWFDLPTSVATAIAAGNGLCIYTDRTSATDLPEYIELHGHGTSYPPQMEITVTKD